MTFWRHKIDSVTAGRLWRNELTSLVVYDRGNDYQRGDTIAFTDDGAYLKTWTITHVTKNQAGVEDNYAVLSLKRPDADYWENEARGQRLEAERLARSNAALRGALTKARKRIEQIKAGAW